MPRRARYLWSAAIRPHSASFRADSHPLRRQGLDVGSDFARMAEQALAAGPAVTAGAGSYAAPPPESVPLVVGNTALRRIDTATVHQITSKWEGHYDTAFTQRTYVHASDPDLEQGRRALTRIHKIV